MWAAAADREEPEETCGKGEGNSEPGGGKHRLTEVCVKVIRLENIVEGAEQGAVKDGGGKRGSKDEDGCQLRCHVSSIIDGHWTWKG